MEVVTANGVDRKPGFDDITSTPAVVANGVNGHYPPEPSLEQLESELPVVLEGQVPLGELLSRVVQAIYAELVELAET